jgi:hypothetical protein
MTGSTKIFTTLDELIDGWCERRALKALRLTLPGYHSVNGLTDGWQQLYAALRDVRATCKDELNKEEREKLNGVIVSIESLLDNR